MTPPVPDKRRALPRETFHYIVRCKAEETACDECGTPLYIGDRATAVEPGYVFCSGACIRRWIQRYGAL